MTGGELLCVDIWPAAVEAPWWRGGVPQQARVFVTTHRVFVFTAPADPANGTHYAPRLSLEAWHNTPVERQRGTFYGQLDLDTDQGPLTVTRGQGCGCHNPLQLVMPPVAW